MRLFLLKLLLGKNVTTFITQKESDIYELEIADSRKRKRLLRIEVEKVTPIRYRLKGYLPF